MNKKDLYESIMRDVSKTVKKHLNESKEDTITYLKNCQDSLNKTNKYREKICDLLAKENIELYEVVADYMRAEQNALISLGYAVQLLINEMKEDKK